MTSPMAAVPALPEIIGGRYRVIREIGRGGMGIVYLVEHVHTGDHLALKVLLGHAGADPATVERFKREARAPARIKSDHVVKITDADVAPELGGAPFLVMELLEGTSLDARLQGGISNQETIAILIQLARALDKAHRLGIVHRDLKPENLFLQRREDGGTTLKILDFGISKFTTEGAGIEKANVTSTGTIMGTPLYMSPEQARGMSAQIGGPTDIWAVGLIAFHMLTGRVYWSATTVADLIVKILVEPMPLPTQVTSGLTPAFDRWFVRSCDRNPASRWSTATEQITALAQLLDCEHIVRDVSVSWTGKRVASETPAGGATSSTAVAARTASAMSTSSDGLPGRRSMLALWIGGALLLALVAGGAVVLSRSKNAPAQESVTVLSPAAPTVVASEGAANAPQALAAPKVPPETSPREDAGVAAATVRELSKGHTPPSVATPPPAATPHAPKPVTKRPASTQYDPAAP